ncbi:TetR family transcriptional regulator [Frondihabitans sp. PAMC 28766]|uniref:TetR/AcrR family transcriptional regulator n=1 Tax=Frondihabitans sp. PAMC 28766 TaxID=1795630 RepID=UPI00078B9A45|nr:TetR/AcrR family transcriptional regulator [Frondihabitans sp. PAMC 28766]AMM20469.1 TetR family transcriptional regulator [Frondihabitans sp. PAMC 28766]
MPTPVKPVRADAVRNRALLLAAAEEEFVERGLDASIADIAARAGVAKGTVFRHFDTKDDLIAAIVETHMIALTTTAHRLLESDDAGAALLEFLTVAADRRQQRDVSFLMTASAANPLVATLRDDLVADVGSLVEKARNAGAIRADITGTDVFLLICAPVHVVEFLADPPPDLWRRYLGIIFDGMRPQGATPLSMPAPSWP